MIIRVKSLDELLNTITLISSMDHTWDDPLADRSLFFQYQGHDMLITANVFICANESALIYSIAPPVSGPTPSQLTTFRRRLLRDLRKQKLVQNALKQLSYLKSTVYIVEIAKVCKYENRQDDDVRSFMWKAKLIGDLGPARRFNT